MSKTILEFPDRRAIEEEAAQWLMKLDGDDAPSAEDLGALREWVARSQTHGEELGSLASLWGKMNVLTDLAVPLGRAERKKRHFLLEVREAAFGMNRRYSFGLAAVATAVLVAGIAIGYTTWMRPDPFVASNGLYATTIGQQQTTTLADGSVIMLNTNSQIKVDYGEAYRDIRLLQGEAHFTVAKKADKPFRVYAGNGRAQAIGTAFSVYLKDQAMKVTVTEGRVALASLTRAGPDGQLLPAIDSSIEPSAADSVARLEDLYVETLTTLKAGGSASIQNIAGGQVRNEFALDSVETIDSQELAKRLSWRKGLLTFNGDPLEDVVNEISRYTTVSVEIADPAVRAIKIGGRFPIGETEAMFEALETNFALQVTRLSQDHVLLSAASE